jgi:hypothetical protein
MAENTAMSSPQPWSIKFLEMVFDELRRFEEKSAAAL